MLLFGLPVRTQAQDEIRDFHPENQEWNGLSQFASIVRQTADRVEIRSELDLGELSPHDGLILVYPTESVPDRSLVAFLRAGGRVALLDDFGGGEELLDAYGITRVPGTLDEAPMLRGNPQLPIALPLIEHNLTQGVSTLVTNHPTLVYHPELRPLFGQTGSDNAIVLSGAVGEGRLIVVSDPSIVINNMLTFRGNERFARNLATYVSRNRSGSAEGRLYILTPDAEYEGYFGAEENQEQFDRLNDWFRELAGAQLPGPVMLALSVLSLLVLVGLTLGTLPRSSPYSRLMSVRGGPLAAAPPEPGGTGGQLAYFERNRKDLFHPLMVYKYELEAEVVKRLEMGDRTLLKDVVHKLEQRQVPREDIHRARRLFLELDQLSTAREAGRRAVVSESVLNRLVESGEQFLNLLASESDERNARSKR